MFVTTTGRSKATRQMLPSFTERHNKSFCGRLLRNAHFTLLRWFSSRAHINFTYAHCVFLLNAALFDDQETRKDPLYLLYAVLVNIPILLTAWFEVLACGAAAFGLMLLFLQRICFMQPWFCDSSTLERRLIRSKHITSVKFTIRSR